MRPRRGAALPAVILVLALTSALVVSGAFVSRRVAAAARTGLRESALEPECERLLVEAVAGWDSAGRSSQPLGSVEALASTPLPGPGASSSSVPRMETHVWATRLTADVFWLVASARTTAAPVLQRRLGVVVRVKTGVPEVAAPRGWGTLP